MKNLNAQFDLIRQSATVAMADRILALKASGEKIIGLQVGDPDFGTAPAIIDVAMQAMNGGLTHYTSSRGNADLLNAIAKKLQRDEGVTYDPASEILVTQGGIHAYYTAMQSVLNPGEDVLVPDPSWATHSNMAIMLRGNVIRVPAPAENGFIPYFESWEKALTPKTRLIVLNYPCNPTGAYPTREYLQRLQDFAKAHDLWIVSDAQPLPKNLLSIVFGTALEKSSAKIYLDSAQFYGKRLNCDCAALSTAGPDSVQINFTGCGD